jgi:nucleoid-associated protein YgaU
MMIAGYGMSCLTRLYDLEPIPGSAETWPLVAEMADEIKEIEKEREKKRKDIPPKATDAEKKAEEDRIKAAEDRNKTEEERIKAEADRKKAEEERIKAEEDRIKAEADAAIAAVKAVYEPKIAAIKEPHKEAEKRAREINEGYIDPETGQFVKGLYDRRSPKLAASPVIPPFWRAEGRNWKQLLAEPPFMRPPSDDPGDLEKAKPVRVWNYWMMGKRTVNQSFMMFAIGFAIFLYGLFVIVCDLGSVTVGVFRTFGMNPLAAYVIHKITEHTIHTLVPRDSPIWFCMVGFGVFFLITYLLVRGLEKQNIYIRM